MYHDSAELSDISLSKLNGERHPILALIFVSVSMPAGASTTTVGAKVPVTSTLTEVDHPSLAVISKIQVVSPKISQPSLSIPTLISLSVLIENIPKFQLGSWDV